MMTPCQSVIATENPEKSYNHTVKVQFTGVILFVHLY